MRPDHGDGDEDVFAASYPRRSGIKDVQKGEDEDEQWREGLRPGGSYERVCSGLITALSLDGNN